MSLLHVNIYNYYANLYVEKDILLGGKIHTAAMEESTAIFRLLNNCLKVTQNRLRANLDLDLKWV